MKIKIKITRQENATFFNCAIDDIVEVEFEEYVAAVVASEFASGGSQGCRAQAVASRTFAVARGVLHGKVISDSSSTAQAYRANRYNSKYQTCIDATMATAGQILTYGGKPISAVFSASNGGYTVSSKERWGGARAYLIAQYDIWDASAGTGRTGHGVGMSQRGARYAGQHGQNYLQILKFYYPGTKLVRDYGNGEEVTSLNEKVDKVIETAKACMGFPYVYGAWGEECTPSNRRRRIRAEHPTIVTGCQVLNPKSKATSCEGCKHQGQLIFDCRGFTYYCLKQAGIEISGGGATTQYNTTRNWMKQGKIKDMPNVVCCVFQKNSLGRMTHTGLHIGDGNIIHCQVGVQTGRTSDKAWTHFAIPKGLYNEIEIKESGEVISMATLKKGSSGEEVMQLQQILNGLGYDCGVADGKFGSKTQTAVQAFQKDRGLTVDGLVGPATWEILLKTQEKGEEEPQDPEDETVDEVPEDDVIQMLFDQVKELREEVKELREKIENKGFLSKIFG